MVSEADVLLADARELCDEGLYDNAIAVAWAAADAGLPREAGRLMMLCADANASPSRLLHVVVVGDSLALPRPERLSRHDPLRRPHLSTPRGGTVPLLLEALLRAQSDRPATVTCLARASFGIRDVVTDAPMSLGYLDPDAVVVLAGIVDVWIEDGAGGEPRLDPQASSRSPWTSSWRTTAR
ncbi:MAG: hypothetical protein ACYC91_03920 [Solirubrobacteraceae bacterium]